MKKFIPACLRSFLFASILLLMGYNSFASHIVAAELRYKWVSGNTYQVSVYLYGDCGPSSSLAFSTLPYSAPQVCLYDGNTARGFVTCTIQPPTTGTEVTPVCPDSLGFTQCTNPSYSLPGIKKFVYQGTTTLPYTSANWRFIYEGYNGAGSAAGRAAAITNLFSPGSTLMQLIDTLNNSATNTRGHNSSPVLTVEPIPYFCNNTTDCYNPGAVDLYDVGPGEPAGDSLTFTLIAATNGSGSSVCSLPGGPWTYVGTSCPGTPVSGTHPLTVLDCSSSSFNFDGNTGQLCYYPNVLQRSVVVYNIDEFRNDTVSTTPLVVNKVQVGSMQREMTFLVLPCSTTTPIGGIDSVGGAGITIVDSFHVYSCANSGTFSFKTDPRESDTALHITVTATGLSAGFTFTVVNNGTNSPTAYISGNTSLITPGHYVIYLNYTDNHCPLVGSKTYAFTIDILPVPTITETTITPATCTDSAVVKFTPGGTGKPWTIKLSSNPPTFPLSLDSFRIFTMDTAAFTTKLKPGSYYMTIFTAVSNDCHIGIPFTVDTPHFTITASKTDPTYCGAKDGTIRINGLSPITSDTLLYKYYSTIISPRIGIATSAAGTDTLTGLLAGVYDSIVVQEGNCFTNPVGPLNLINPPFTWRTFTTGNAKRCGFCNGVDTLFGLHPGQLDTITYTYISEPAGITSTRSLSGTIGPDSMLIMTGLCSGQYKNFIVNTAGVCSYEIFGPDSVKRPRLYPSFNDVIHYGCNIDTLFLTNTSTTDSIGDTALAYKWAFGDGVTSTLASPKHSYTPTNNTNFTVRFYITNSVCVDSDSVVINLNNYIVPGFTLSPSPYVCQGNPVTFANTSTGTNLSYMWQFGDGTTDITPSPTHIFTTTGTYKVKLIASDHIVPLPPFFSPCFDTAYGSITVDSNSQAAIITTDSIICRGQAIQFNGIYAPIGDTLVNWTFGDGNGTEGVNPILHAFDGTGWFTVTLDVKYRACPEVTATHLVHTYAVPNLYLGPDTAMCPGSNAVMLADNNNASIYGAKWTWNTGETTSSILVTKPGTYYAVVSVDGCTASDTVVVNKDCYVDIPNIFTPNGDGVNDYFFPRQMLTRGVVQFKMDIYNRWGQNVYETESTDGRGWDGSFNNKPQPEGVYIYMIDVKFKDGEMEHHQGNVTLLR